MSTSCILKKLDSYNMADRDLIGNKAYNLLRMYMNGAHIPETWILDSSYIRKFMEMQNIYSDGIKIDDFKSVRIILQTEEFIRYLSKSIRKDYNSIHPEGSSKSWAIRSSSCLEDSKSSSFAGMFTTVLNVRCVCNVIDSIYKVVVDSFSEEVEFLCRINGIERMKLPAVIIQEFVYSQVGGVTFRQNGISTSNLAIGLTKGIVDGISGTDVWCYDEQSKEIHCDINEKKCCVLPVNSRTNPLTGEKCLLKMNGNKAIYKCIRAFDESGLIVAEVPTELMEKQLVDNDSMKDILECMGGIADKLSIKEYDAEWCIDNNNKFFLLQIRDLTRQFEPLKRFTSNKTLPIVAGKAIGRTCVVKNEKDLKNFKKGDILVTELINGKAIQAVLDASACIIQTSSVLSHSAIIARELGLPCIGVDDINDIRNFTYIKIDGDLGKYDEIEEIDTQNEEETTTREFKIDRQNVNLWKENLLVIPHEWEENST